MRRPRVRDSEERFESRVLPVFARKSKKLAELIPELYHSGLSPSGRSLHGLAEGDFDPSASSGQALALRGLWGDDAPVSASTVARLKEKWQAELAERQKRPLDDLAVAYLWVDGVYVKAGCEREKAAILVAIAALAEDRKVVLAVTPGYRESTESWSGVVRDLKRRGLNSPKLVVGDGNPSGLSPQELALSKAKGRSLGIWGALRNVYPDAAEQRCWNHKIVNVMDKHVLSLSKGCPRRSSFRPASGCAPSPMPGRARSASG